MTADKLLARRKGEAFNAEEALAARQILAKSGNELVNAAKAISKRDDPGEELLSEFRRKWVRHVAIQEQVSGMTAVAPTSTPWTYTVMRRCSKNACALRVSV